MVPGALVACPLGPRRVLGVVVGRGPATHRGRLVPVAGVVAAPPVPPELVELAMWVARYYLAPAAACLRLVLPPGAEGTLRRRPGGEWALAEPPSGARSRPVAALLSGAPAPAGRGAARRAAVLASLAEAGGRLDAAELCRRAATTLPTLRRMAADGQLELADVSRDASPLLASGPPPAPDAPPVLTDEQAVAVARVEGLIAGGGGSLLLHGVTGSGKTEVYLRAIAAARAAGRTSLVLVPEIALTPQLLHRLRARLGEGVAVWHSALSPSERAAEHRRVREGRADVVLGARSAVFAPLADLGLVVVDEEHDASYKQDTLPRYDARQVAFKRAAAAGAAVVYGSATPRPGVVARPAARHALAPRRRRPAAAGRGGGHAHPAGGPGLAAARPGARGRRRARREGDPAAQPARFRAHGPLPLMRLDRALPALRRGPGARRPAGRAGLPPLRPRRPPASDLSVVRRRRGRAPGQRHRGPRARPRSACCPASAWCGWTPTARPAAGPSAACWPSSPGRARRSCSAPRWSRRATTCPT